MPDQRPIEEVEKELRTLRDEADRADYAHHASDGPGGGDCPEIVKWNRRIWKEAPRLLTELASLRSRLKAAEKQRDELADSCRSLIDHHEGSATFDQTCPCLARARARLDSLPRTTTESAK